MADVYTPYVLPITGITRAQQAVVSFGTSHPYTPGEILSFRVSTPYGMTQMNNVQATVLAISSESVTMAIDSTFFNNFIYPPSGTVVIPAVAVPVGSGIIPGSIPPTVNLQDVFDHTPGN